MSARSQLLGEHPNRFMSSWPSDSMCCAHVYVHVYIIYVYGINFVDFRPLGHRSFVDFYVEDFKRSAAERQSKQTYQRSEASCL